MLLVDAHGTPLAADVASASPAEVKLIETLLDRSIVRQPSRLVYDKAADIDPLRERLAHRQIELVCPHRTGRKRPNTQDARKLGAYRRLWIVERSISWLFSFRRLVVRSERLSSLFLGFVHLACVYTILKGS